MIGADGVPVGVVDRVGGADQAHQESSGEDGMRHHHYVPGNLVAEVEGDEVRLSANADVAVLFEVEEDSSPLVRERARV